MPLLNLDAVRLGLIGAGSVVETYHLPALRGLSSVKISWACDHDLARAQSLARTFKIGRSFAALEECPDVDVVLVAIPVGSRRPVLDIVTARRWHALCEKPFAPTTLDHQWIIERARQQGVRLGIGLQRRHYASTALAQQLIASRLLGSIRQIIAGEGMLLRRTGRGGDWYQGSAQASGGTLFETGSHLVDQIFTVCQVCDYRIEHCRQDGWNDLELETHATGSLLLTSGDRVPFALVVSHMRDVYNGIVVRMDQGEIRIRLGPEQPVELCTDKSPAMALAFPIGAVVNMPSAMLAEWKTFLAQCAESADFSNWDTAFLTTRFIEDCFQSAAGRRSQAVEVG